MAPGAESEEAYEEGTYRNRIYFGQKRIHVGT